MLLVMQVFALVVTFSGNSVHPPVTIINSMANQDAPIGYFAYNLDGEIGNFDMSTQVHDALVANVPAGDPLVLPVRLAVVQTHYTAM